MKRIFLLASFFLAFSLAAMAEDGFHIRIKEYTGPYTWFTGEKIPAKKISIDLWIGEKALALIMEEGKYIVDNGNHCMILLNTKHKTYMKLPLPLDLKGHLDDYALLRYQHYWMRFSVYDVPNSGSVEETGEYKTIQGKECTRFKKITVGKDELSRFESTSIVWATTDVPFNLAAYNELNVYLQAFLEYNNSKEFNDELKKIKGFPLLEETEISRGPIKAKTIWEVAEWERKKVPAGMFSVPGAYFQKTAISYDELMTRRIGAAQEQLGREEKGVYSVLEKLQKGFTERDTSIVEEWVDDLFTEDVYCIGADAPFPNMWEWRRGRKAAIEIFRADWLYWGDFKLYMETADISVEGNAAWAAVFATNTRKPGMKRYRDAETLRQAIVRVINDKVNRDEWSTRRRLYEVIYDASWALVEYERAKEFICPMQLTFGFIKRDGKWKIKQWHWQNPSEGIPLLKLIKLENR